MTHTHPKPRAMKTLFWMAVASNAGVIMGFVIYVLLLPTHSLGLPSIAWWEAPFAFCATAVTILALSFVGWLAGFIVGMTVPRPPALPIAAAGMVSAGFVFWLYQWGLVWLFRFRLDY